MVKLSEHVSYILIVFFLFCFQASADGSNIKGDEVSLNKLEFSVVKLIVTPTILTPGQQLNIVLKVNYADKAEIVFNPQQVDWQDFTLLSSNEVSPQWFDNHWQKQYHISLSAPVAGQYQLPILTIHSYLAEHHNQLSTSTQIIKVLKAVTLIKNADSSVPSIEQAALTDKDNALTLPQLQDIERINLDDNAQLNIALLVFIVVMLILTSLITYWFVHLKIKKHLLQQITPTTQQALIPTQLINSFESNNCCDWQKLQQWLEKQIEQQSNLPEQVAIKQQYQQLISRLLLVRFSAENQHYFLSFCQQCQQFHNDSEQSMLTSLVTNNITVTTYSTDSN